jgi:alpha-L-glutamate ligase-like protein
MRNRRRVSLWRRARRVLGLNARNLLYVHSLNPRRHFPLADDKIQMKAALAAASIPFPPTLAVMANLAQVTRAQGLLDSRPDFVIKPARGRQGGGILVVTGREGTDYRLAGGRRLGWDSLRQHMGDILFGVHSVGHADRVLVEERVRAPAALGALAAEGLPDVRIILLRARPALAMMRIPTRASEGRANLHQGAPGVALRLSDGYAYRATIRGAVAPLHPDSGASLTGFTLPGWPEIIDLARRAAAALPLPYLGVDIVLDEHSGPLVMEVNVRPGLEIQNVNRRGLRQRLERLTLTARPAP